MEEEVDSMLKCKLWKFLTKHSDLKHDEDPKNKLNLELEVEDLGSANIVLSMETGRIKSHRKLLLCQR